MSVLPGDWSQQIQGAYPKRSGPCGWGGMKLMLAVRRALMSVSWDQIMEGVERYAGYCKISGKEGTEYVLSPKNFFEDAIYAEEFTYAAPKTKEEIAKVERDSKEAERWITARDAAGRLRQPVEPLRGESVAAFETRIRLEKDRPSRTSRDVLDGSSGSGGDGGGSVRGSDPQLSGRIASLADRMRIAK